MRRALTRAGGVAVRRIARLTRRGGERVMGTVDELPRGKSERVARAVVVAHVLLMAGGTAAALALLPPDLPGAALQNASLAGAQVAASRIAEGEKVVPRAARPRRPGAAYYRKIASRRVPPSAETRFLALYREAARTFGVSWRLIASIHRQETAFSSVPSTYHGLNSFGCCAGPMQFNVTNGPVSTWDRYRQSFRLGSRPRRYPHPTRHHPSIYDDFDAIMAAAALLRDSGATELLDGGAWSAAYAYYGHDRFGTGYASQVLGRARGWERDGFCVNCPLDESLVAEFDDAYGVDARRVLRAAERRKKHRHKHKKHHRRAEQDREQPSRKASEAPQAATGDAPPTPPPATQTTATPTTTTTTTTTPTMTTTNPQPAPAPPPPACSALKKLLGCRD